MNGDPAVDPVIDGFSRILPLPYRVSLIIVLGRKTLNYLQHYETIHPIRRQLTQYTQAFGLGASTSTTSPS